MESDPWLSFEEKSALLKEWWEKDFSEMASVGYTPACFVKMVTDSRILFRNGTTDLLKFISAANVPMFVISAGIKEIIDVSF